MLSLLLWFQQQPESQGFPSLLQFQLYVSVSRVVQGCLAQPEMLDLVVWNAYAVQCHEWTLQGIEGEMVWHLNAWHVTWRAHGFWYQMTLHIFSPNQSTFPNKKNPPKQVVYLKEANWLFFSRKEQDSKQTMWLMASRTQTALRSGLGNEEKLAHVSQEGKYKAPIATSLSGCTSSIVGNAAVRSLGPMEVKQSPGRTVSRALLLFVCCLHGRCAHFLQSLWGTRDDRKNWRPRDCPMSQGCMEPLRNHSES